MDLLSPISKISKDTYVKRFHAVRNRFLDLVAPLQVEDFVVQPAEFVSPPKWHLAHTTWFFEVFLLLPNLPGYKLFNKDYPMLFNSYYVSEGDRWTRAERGFLTRPTLGEILEYRQYVEEHMSAFFDQVALTNDLEYVLEVGIQHEQQHQELFLYDIKYILGINPLFPRYKKAPKRVDVAVETDLQWLGVDKGNYLIGFEGKGFCWDNELGRHEVHLEAYEVMNRMVTNREYLDFMGSGGYENHMLWLSEGWDWINQREGNAPLYWVHEDDGWMTYTMQGLQALDLDAPVSHLSYYEADAYAKYKGCRLPTEQEWEVAAGQYGDPKQGNFIDRDINAPIPGANDFFGNLWEWTASDYAAYPFYKPPQGALGEYNGKFMVNQKVLRGGSYATPLDHIRLTYRNFFHPQMQWMFAGIRLARHKR